MKVLRWCSTKDVLRNSQLWCSRKELRRCNAPHNRQPWWCSKRAAPGSKAQLLRCRTAPGMLALMCTTQSLRNRW